ncbi:M13 family metallopeptidase [Rhizomicrobium electricum]|uniref:M13 family metallopeptidase n=1 Tax=Rhizomicrobium electricum TaxID=480070 RepID=A0ABP3QBU8_9PROT|nr:M13 family metallopeptidase [Rhizomicrobium electricum]NIJ46777.1 putative metalloendopeptidase [Rhizomicrobium electricum]
MNRRLTIAAALLIMAGCSAPPPPPPPAPPPGPKATLGQWGVDFTGMDRSVKPGDDFYMFVNGKWQKDAVIPADRSSTGSFQTLAILSEKRMKEIVAELEAKPVDKLSPEEKKLRDLYDGFTDTKAIEARGLEPVKADLAMIGKLKTLKDVARVMGSPRLAAGSIFGLGIGVDDKDSSKYSVNLTPEGLGLPDRDFYLLDEAGIVKVREAYKAYLGTMLSLTGAKDADARAAKVMALETGIAKLRWSLAQQRDPEKMYHPVAFKDLRKLAPAFPWDAFFSETEIPLNKGARVVIVGENSAVGPIAKLFAKTPVGVWRDYLTIHYLHSYAAVLPQKIDDADFAFYGTALAGRTAQTERATRGVRLLDRTLGEAFGKLYVAKYFPPEAKAKVEKLVSNLLKAYEADIKTLPWMSEATRQKALDKIHAFTPHLGYPDVWRDYAALEISRDDLVGNMKRASMFEWHHDVARLDQAVDRNEWHMTPPTVNAYYNPSFNSITFPAAILQPPFFDPNADDAVNYGAIGVVIGHEISHGFDDQGSKYNGAGNMENWWTDTDLTNFQARTKMLTDQYSAFEPLPGLHVRGDATLGENIADLAGLSISYKAYHIALGGQAAPVLDGFTGDQRFFMGLAQVWQSKFREGELRSRILSDVHSPAAFRVIGSTRNVDAWYEAFDVKPGDKYYLPPDQRVKLW